jgi:hypothetical protein
MGNGGYFKSPFSPLGFFLLLIQAIFFSFSSKGNGVRYRISSLYPSPFTLLLPLLPCSFKKILPNCISRRLAPRFSDCSQYAGQICSA